MLQNDWSVVEEIGGCGPVAFVVQWEIGISGGVCGPVAFLVQWEIGISGPVVQCSWNANLHNVPNSGILPLDQKANLHNASEYFRMLQNARMVQNAPE